ncbi:hypothetical protein [Niallia sp. 03133]|uniref:hypothetical protein n=1 Tax=Niallia sp. 03133 TaxID=3458060 RepID=UPI004043CF0B
MKSVKKSLDTLREIYSNNLSVALIAEELLACAPEDNAISIKLHLEKLDFDFYGVERQGKIIGYIIQSELRDGLISDYMHPFKMEEIVSDSTSLIEVLEILRDKHPVFVLERNQIKKLITVADLQKQPIRMLVFGLISMLEMNLVELIKQNYAHEQWKACLNENRIQKAIEIFRMRKNKNEGLGLIDCLQLSDKGEIILKTPSLLDMLGFRSKTEVKQFFKAIEELRNNTAHSQEYVYEDFTDFLDIITRMEKMLSVFR